jgi:hypothetical protein
MAGNHGPNGYHPGDASIASLRQAHPILDPHFADHQPELHRLWSRQYDLIRDNDEVYNTHLNKRLRPSGVERTFQSNLVEIAFYLNEATKYLESLLELLPRRRATRLRPAPRICECNDLRLLMGLAFTGNGGRLAYEARRKLYLSDLFFDVAHTRAIQRGDDHRDFFADRMGQGILRRTVAERDVDVAFNIASDGQSIQYEIGRPLPNQEVWRFRVREMEIPQDDRPVRIHVYFYSCRSKREVLPYSYERGQQVYRLQTVEKWSRLSMRRDASIVSKMLRKGLNHPGAIPDIIGAMFIVEDLEEVEHLKLALIDELGGPFQIRNVIDTLRRPEDRDHLNRFSGAGYRVYKCEADVLYRPQDSDEEPYSFNVEIQIYTLETYLRTIHADHYASHHQLKRRQFLEGIVPLLFPQELYPD